MNIPPTTPKLKTSISCDAVPSSNPATANNPHQFDQTTLIYFSSDQSSKLAFPPGCPVWYNFHSISDSTNENQSTFCKGCIVAVAMDCVTRKIVYKIQRTELQSNNEKIDVVSEEDVTYAMGCSVWITVEGRELDGEIICSSIGVLEQHQMETKYSVLFSKEKGVFQVIHGVNAQQIKYRHEAVEELSKPQDPIPNKVSIIPSNNKSETNDTSRGSSQGNIPQQAQLKWTPPSPNKRRKRVDSTPLDLNAVEKRQIGLRLFLTVPQWALKAKPDLCDVLIANRPSIEKKTNCPVQITQKPNLKIGISSASPNNHERNHSVVIFHRHVQDLLIAHLNDNNSKGRLLFDLAKSATGNYKISTTTSGAVKQQSIVEMDGLVWMRLLNVSSSSLKSYFSVRFSRCGPTFCCRIS